MNEDNSNIDYSQFINLYRNILNSNESTNYYLSPLDELIDDQNLRIAKVIIPYLDYANQKKLSTVIRILELKKTMDFYNTMQTSQLPNKPLDKINLLKDMLNCCEGQNKKIINLLLVFMNMQNISKNNDFPELTSANNNPNNQNYNGLINMVNKILKEKEGE